MLIHYQNNPLCKARFLHIFWACLFVFSIESSIAIAAGEYLLGDGDTVSIKVYGQSDLTVDARISPEGTIPYPLLEEVAIGGLTPEAAGRKIARRLKDEGFIKSLRWPFQLRVTLASRYIFLGKSMIPGITHLRVKIQLLI